MRELYESIALFLSFLLTSSWLEIDSTIQLKVSCVLSSSQRWRFSKVFLYSWCFFFVALSFVFLFTLSMSKVHVWRSFCSCHIRTSSWRSRVRVFREKIDWNWFCSFEVALKARCVTLCVSCVNLCVYVSLLMLKFYNALRWSRFFKSLFKFISFVRVWARSASSSRNVDVSMTKELSRELC